MPRDRSKPKSEKVKKVATPPIVQPWEVPPPPTNSDTKEETLYHAVGIALTAWETLEDSLSKLFATLVAPREEQLPARRAYGAILGFKSRVAMIAAAAAAVFYRNPNTTLSTEIGDLLTSCGMFAARRNEIAHGRVKARHHSSRWGDAPRIDYVLAPAGHATTKTRLAAPIGILQIDNEAPTYAYSSVEIETFRAWFRIEDKEARRLTLLLNQHQLRGKP